MLKKIILASLVLTSGMFVSQHEDASNKQVAYAAAKYKNPIKTNNYNYYSKGSCAYYAFNRRAQLKRHVSNQWGNARNWAYNAQRNGYTVKKKPIFGAVMVSQKGYYGHVSVVERVNRDGSILVSEMNYPKLGVKTFRTVPKNYINQHQFIY